MVPELGITGVKGVDILPMSPMDGSYGVPLPHLLFMNGLLHDRRSILVTGVYTVPLFLVRVHLLKRCINFENRSLRFFFGKSKIGKTYPEKNTSHNVWREEFV